MLQAVELESARYKRTYKKKNVGSWLLTVRAIQDVTQKRSLPKIRMHTFISYLLLLTVSFATAFQNGRHKFRHHPDRNQ